MGTAYLTIDAEILRDLLGLPSDCVLASSASRKISLLVSHRTIPPGTRSVNARYKATASGPEFECFMLYDGPMTGGQVALVDVTPGGQVP